jgi:hypothetical protein
VRQWYGIDAQFPAQLRLVQLVAGQRAAEPQEATELSEVGQTCQQADVALDIGLDVGTPVGHAGEDTTMIGNDNTVYWANAGME